MGKVSDLKNSVEPKNEEGIDIQKVIKDLIDTDFGTDNDMQGKMVQMMKGLAFSDDPKATDFMKKVSDMMGKMNPEDFA